MTSSNSSEDFASRFSPFSLQIDSVTWTSYPQSIFCRTRYVLIPPPPLKSKMTRYLPWVYAPRFRIKTPSRVLQVDCVFFLIWGGFASLFPMIVHLLSSTFYGVNRGCSYPASWTLCIHRGMYNPLFSLLSHPVSQFPSSSLFQNKTPSSSRLLTSSILSNLVSILLHA